MSNERRERVFAETLFKRLHISVDEVESRERPDLLFRWEDKQIGMEITESTPSEQYWGQEIAQKLGGDPLRPIIYSSSHLRNHGRKRSKDEVFEDMFNNPNYSDMDEDRRTWCEDVRTQWERKRKKLNEPTYSRFDENWLLIWDNDGLGDDWSTLTNIQQEVHRTRFFIGEGDEFHHVFVLSGNYTLDFSAHTVAFRHEKQDEVNAWINPRRDKSK